jgi:peptide/nickel transport system substrate-binding protein
MGFFVPSSKSANDAGMEFVRNPNSTDEVKRMLDSAKYNGEKIGYLHPTDQLVYNAMSTVVVDAFRKTGLNIDEQMTDRGTVVQRRPTREPLDKGGWSIFPALEYIDPCSSIRCASTAPSLVRLAQRPGARSRLRSLDPRAQ